jgi:large subunit ribosomal protein L16
MLMPKRVKWRKQQRGRMRGQAGRGTTVDFGDYGLQALEPGWVTARQLEAARRSLVRYMRRRGKVWIRVFPDKPVTQRAAETRMGKGKGAVDHWVAVVKPGRVVIEISGLDEANAREALRRAAHKLSIKVKFAERLDLFGGE